MKFMIGLGGVSKFSLHVLVFKHIGFTVLDGIFFPQTTVTK